MEIKGLLSLETKCEACEGDGYTNTGRRCSSCYGRGAFPTEAGRELLRFLKAHITLEIDDDGTRLDFNI